MQPPEQITKLQEQQTFDHNEHQMWLSQTVTQKMLRRLEKLRLSKLELAATKNQSTQITELELRRLLSEATGVDYAIKFLQNLPPVS